jgi:hypothetical protein
VPSIQADARAKARSQDDSELGVRESIATVIGRNAATL